MVLLVSYMEARVCCESEIARLVADDRRAGNSGGRAQASLKRFRIFERIPVEDGKIQVGKREG